MRSGKVSNVRFFEECCFGRSRSMGFVWDGVYRVFREKFIFRFLILR